MTLKKLSSYIYMIFDPPHAMKVVRAIPTKEKVYPLTRCPLFTVSALIIQFKFLGGSGDDV